MLYSSNSYKKDYEMKTIKLQREGINWSFSDFNWLKEVSKFPQDFEWETQNGRHFMCAKILHKIFRINRCAKSLWVTIRNKPAKGFYKVKYELTKGHGLPYILIDGKRHDIYLAAEQFLIDNGIEVGQEFYVSIDYSLDK